MALCSILLVIMCFPLFLHVLATDLNAQLSDSVPPDVKYISSGVALIVPASTFLAFSIAFLLSPANS